MPHDPSFDSNALVVATDDNYSVQGDDYDNSATKVEPSAGQVAQGVMRPGQQVGAQHLNWFLHQFAAIFLALIANDVAHETRLDDDEALLVVHENRLDDIDSWIANNSPRLKIIEYLTPASFVPATRVVAALAIGCGGGGGGGKGSNGTAVEDRWMAGAGGGGGSELVVIPLPPIEAGESYDVDVGLGGQGALVAGSTGNDGADSTIKHGVTVIATFPGAQGGRGAVGSHAREFWVHFSFGGLSRKGTQVMLIGPAGQGIRWDTSTGSDAPFGHTASFGPHSLYIPLAPGAGGWGAGGSTNPGAAVGSPTRFGSHLGGAAGTQGASVAGAKGGGGGGGGGAGPFGPGGAGGTGSNVLEEGSSPQSGGANTGAGGGGSGSVGYTITGILPRNGAYGGSGRVYLVVVQESA